MVKRTMHRMPTEPNPLRQSSPEHKQRPHKGPYRLEFSLWLSRMNIAGKPLSTASALQQGILYRNEQPGKAIAMTRSSTINMNPIARGSSHSSGANQNSPRRPSKTRGGTIWILLQIVHIPVMDPQHFSHTPSTRAGVMQSYLGRLWKIKPQIVLAPWPINITVFEHCVQSHASVAKAIVSE